MRAPFRRSTLAALRGFESSGTAITLLPSAADYRQTLLAKIAAATRRIYIVALYLQQDEAGQEILDALYAAKAARPELDVVVLVDWFRAQRGLIGAGKQAGNSAWYQAQNLEHDQEVPVYGVPVQTRELFGVLHLKGCVIDDCVIYSGASINNVYLHKLDKYRLDRYHVVDSTPLADALRTWCSVTSCLPERCIVSICPRRRALAACAVRFVSSASISSAPATTSMMACVTTARCASFRCWASATRTR